MTPALTRFFIAALCFMAFGFGLTVQATSLRCSKDPVVFNFKNNEGLECLCKTASKSISLLKSMGFLTTDCITVTLTNDFPSKSSHSLFGTYDPKTQNISILTYSRAKDILSEWNLDSSPEMNKDLWCSFAAHELAHAVIHQNQSKMKLSRVAAEYIACVTQLSVLAPATLNNFMDTFGDIEAYNSIEEMTDTYFLLDPNRFAVKCYLHYLSLKNSNEFIAELANSLQ